MGVAKELVSTYGVTGLYCGWYWAMLSGFVEKGLYFFFYAWVKTGWTTYVGDFNVAGELIVGYLAEWTHTPFVQPIDAMLIATQTDSTKDPVTGREPIKRGNVARASAILKAKGIGGFYKGWGSYLLLALKPAIQYYTFNVCKAIVLSRGAARSAPLPHQPSPARSRCADVGSPTQGGRAPDGGGGLHLWRGGPRRRDHHHLPRPACQRHGQSRRR